MRTTKKFATILIFASIFAATPVLATSDDAVKPVDMPKCDWHDFLEQRSDSSNDAEATKPFGMPKCDWHDFLEQLEDHSSKDADTKKQFDLSEWYDFFEKHKTDMQDDALTNAKGLSELYFGDGTETSDGFHHQKNSKMKPCENIDAITQASDMHECECNCCCCKSHHKHHGRPEHRRHQKDSLKTKTSDKNENRKSDRHIYHRWN